MVFFPIDDNVAKFVQLSSLNNEITNQVQPHHTNVIA